MKGADHVHHVLFRVGRSAQVLAVDGDPTAQRDDDAADPSVNRLLELLRVDRPEDAQKGVLRRHVVGQRETAAKPRFLHRGTFGDVLDRVAVGQQAHTTITRIS